MESYHMKTIMLISGRMVKVDDEDYEHLNRFRWTLNSYGYVIAQVQGTLFFMVNEILGKPPMGKEVHHVNGDKLDNQKNNLEIISKSLHGHRRQKNKYKNVHMATDKTRFRAIITKNQIRYDLGTFNTIEEAARAADKKAIELYGSEAILNFPDATN